MPRHSPVRAPGWLFALVVVAAWLLGAELATVISVGRSLPARLPSLALWTFVAVSIGFLLVVGRREITTGRQTAHLLAQLKEALGSFGMLTEASLAALPLDELLAQLLGRLCEVLETEVAAILLTSDERGFAARAAHGFEAEGLHPFEVTPGVGLIGSIVTTRQAQAINDPDRLDLLASQVGHLLGSAAGSPILVEGRLIGVCVVGAMVPHHFEGRRLQLMQLVADRAGVEIERARLADAQRRSWADADQSRRLGLMLANASEVLLTAKDDYQDNLLALVDVAVPDLGDWCSIELVDPGGGPPARRVHHGTRLEFGPTGGPDAYPTGAAALADLRERFPEATDLASSVAASGDARRSSDERCVVAAIRVGDSVFGTMTVAVDPGRPLYRTSDVAIAVELAARAAITIGRVLRYRDARDAAYASQRRAAQLHQLVQASIDVQQLRHESQILVKIAESAREIFDAQDAVVSAGCPPQGCLQAVAQVSEETVLGAPEQRPLSEMVPYPVERPGGPWRAGGWQGAPIGRVGAGMVAIHRGEGELPSDDETVLVLLAQMASTALDSTQLNDAIEASERRWRALVEVAPIGIVEVGLDGQIVWWNRATMALFGWPDSRHGGGNERAPGLANQQRGGGEGPSFAPDTGAGLRALWSEVVEGHEVIDRELTATSAAAGLRDLAVSATPLRASDGAIHSILTLVADVTDRRRLESELRRAQRMEAIGQLAGGVAHDFNNLLTLITGYSELLKQRLGLDQRSAELVDDVHRAAARAALLTGQLLTISRRQIPRPVVLDPARALRSAAQVLERIVGVDVVLGWALDPAAGRVSIDPGQLEQVIVNLATNARDAMAGKGRLDITVSPVTLDRARSDELGVVAGRYIRISLADTGTGMSLETARRCFEPLFTTKRPSEGTGLGLSAVKGAVEEAAGAVRVDSVEGEGTTVAVYLPEVDAAAMGGSERHDQAVSRADQTEPVAGIGRPSGPGSPLVDRTILIADDDEVQRHLMSQVLTRNGYRVLEAASGGQALSAAAAWSGPIAAMVSDVAMPGMSGPDVAATLLKTRPAMRVLFVSGGPDGATQAALVDDPVPFLAKPFRPSQLLARVKELLEGSLAN